MVSDSPGERTSVRCFQEVGGGEGGANREVPDNGVFLRGVSVFHGALVK